MKTLPWTAEYDRRSILWRYSPGNMSFHPSGYSVKEHSFNLHWREHPHRWPASWYEGLDEAAQTVLEPAYASFRADVGRPHLDKDGNLLPRPQAGGPGGRSSYGTRGAEATHVQLPKL